MRISLKVLAALSALVSVAASSREPAATVLRSFTLPGYTLLAPDTVVAERVATMLAQADRVLAQVLERELHASSIPTTVVVLSVADVDRYFGGPHAFFSAPYQSFSNTILITAEKNHDDLRTDIFHQATHSFLRSQFNAEIPVWFSEGLALFMTPNELEGRQVVLGESRFRSANAVESPRRMNSFGDEDFPKQTHEREDWYDIGDLLSARADSPVLSTSENSYFMRRQCWLMAHKAFIDDSQFKQSMFRYLEAVNSFVPIETAVRQSFGMSAADLDRALYRYSQRQSYALSTITFTPPAPSSPGEGTSMPAATMFEQLANLALDSGAELRHIDELIAAAARHGLDAPRLLLLRLRLASQEKDDATVESVLDDLEGKLSEPAVARSAGLAIYERVSRNEDRKAATSPAALQLLARAQDLVSRALKAQPDDAQAAWVNGVIAVRLSRDLDVALIHLEHARHNHPENPDVAAVLATIHFMRSEHEPMIARLQDTLRFSRSSDQRRWAARQLAAARSESTPSAAK